MKVVIGVGQEIYNLFGIPRFSDLPACKKAFYREWVFFGVVTFVTFSVLIP